MKLQTLRPRLATLQSAMPALNAQSTHERVRGRAAVSRRAKWLRENPLCIDCEALDRVTAAEEVDHEIPLHANGLDDESNFSSRCKDHHALKSAWEAKCRAKGGFIPYPGPAEAIKAGVTASGTKPRSSLSRLTTGPSRRF